MKKFHLLILIIAIFQFSCFGQDGKERLLTEISMEKCIECARTGKSFVNSKLFRKADTLNSLTSIKEKLAIIKDSCYILKFYSYRGMLHVNDSLGYITLKEFINDSTVVCYFCGCRRDEKTNFNEAILLEYYGYIKSKYLIGGKVLGGDYAGYEFPKADKRIWKNKLKELKKLIDDSNEKQLIKAIKY